jgi:hypothetical protein
VRGVPNNKDRAELRKSSSPFSAKDRAELLKIIQTDRVELRENEVKLKQDRAELQGSSSPFLAKDRAELLKIFQTNRAELGERSWTQERGRTVFVVNKD